MVAAKIANLKRGGDRKTEDFKASNEGLKIDSAAKALNVGGVALVERAKQVIEHGSKEVVEAVERGERPVSAAAKLVADVPGKQQQTKT